MALVDASNFGAVQVTGDDRVRFLHGLTTINVNTLQPLSTVPSWGAILSPKGRVLSVCALVAEASVPLASTSTPTPNGSAQGALVLYCERSNLDSTLALLQKYAVMDDVEFTLRPARLMRDISAASEVWSAPFREAGDTAASALVPLSEHLRIEAGFPYYGVDVSDANFPFESALGNFLDYGKGCYVGQEPVFRVHSQGQAQKQHRVIRFSGASEKPDGQLMLDGKACGSITSAAAVSPSDWLALAFVSRIAWEPGTVVACQGREGTVGLPVTHG